MPDRDLRALAREQLLRVSRYLARAYVAGDRIDDALAALRRVERRGRAATVGYFNPAGQPAGEIAATCAHVIATLGATPAASGGERSVSLKAPALRFDPGLIGELARQAATAGVALHFDSHAIEAAAPTFAAAALAQAQTPRVGCTLPARWRRSLADADLAAERQLRVRLVKGQWPDPDDPAADVEAGFLHLVDRLGGRVPRVAVATHDPQLARAALGRLSASATPCELEQLYGLPMRTTCAVARELGVPVRVYVPFGAAWLPYALSSLAREPGKLWWLMKDLLAAARSGGR